MNKGFTLVELVMLITVLAIMSVVAVPIFTDIGSVKAVGAAKKLVSDLSLARQLARTRNGIYGISFNAALDTYTVHLYDPLTATETPVTDPLTRSPMVVDFTSLPGLSGVDIQNPVFGGTSVVRFTPQGIPQNDAGVDLGAAGSVVLQNGGQTRTITVQPGTGEVSEQ